MTTTSCLQPVTPTSQRPLVRPPRPAPAGAAKRFLKALLNSLSAWTV